MYTIQFIVINIDTFCKINLRLWKDNFSPELELAIIDKINWYRTTDNKIKYFTMHDLRIIFATKCYYSGVDAKTLQSWLGHKNISTTLEIYVKLDEEKSRRQMNNVAITSNISNKQTLSKGMLN